MIVEDHRDQRDREHQAGDDAKSQLEPHRKERDLLADPFALPVAAIEIIRKYRQQRAEEQFKHGLCTSLLAPPAFSMRALASAVAAACTVPSRRLGWVLFRRNAGHLLDRSGNPAQRRAEVRQVDHGEEQADHPEQVVVREQRQQAQHGHDFKLELLRLVGHPLRQRVQVQIEVTDRENGDDQKNADADHQNVGVIRCGDEGWQVMGRAGVNRLAHGNPPFTTGLTHWVGRLGSIFTQCENLASIKARPARARPIQAPFS